MHASFTLRTASFATAAAFASVLAVPAMAATGSWSTTGPYGGSTSVLAVYEAAPNTLFAGGNGGLFRSIGSGASWQRIEVGLPQSLVPYDLAVSTNAPVLYMTNAVRIFRSGNAGDLWVPVAAFAPDTYINDMSLRRGTSNDIVVATSGGIYVSANGGSSWTGPGAVSTLVATDRVEYAADGTLYAGLGNADPGAFGGALVLRSTDGGTTWAPTAGQPTTLFGVVRMVSSPIDPQFLAISDGFALEVSSNGGATWSQRALPTSGAGCGSITALAAHPTIAAAAFIGCRNNGVHTTANLSLPAPAWTSWTVANGLSVNDTDTVQASVVVVHPAFPATPSLWVGSEYGGLFRSSNGGTSWSAINNAYQSVNIRALATHPIDTGSGAVVLAGQGDATSTTRAISKSPDNGVTWETANSGLNAEQVRSIAIDRTTIDTAPLTAEPFTVYAAGRAERIPTAASKDGGVYKSTNAGATWTTIDNGIAVVNGVRDMGTVRTVALDPRSCAAPPATGPCAIGGGPLQTVFVAGAGVQNVADPTLPFRSARIYKSTNAGASWSASDNGLPLGQDMGPPGAGNYAYMAGVNPVVFDPSNTQTIYIGTFVGFWSDPATGPYPTIANGVFKSTDGGATWVHSSNGLPRLFGPTNSHRDVLAMAINPATPQTLYVGASDLYSSPYSGLVYKTTNGGASWFEASTGISGQDVRALFIDPNDPSGDTVYAGTGGNGANPGGVYRSTNGGVSWNSFSLGLPAYAATALAMPARAIGAPARILAGTNSGVWDYTAAADEDADGAPSGVENAVVGGDGNGDGTPDAQQRGVASLGAPSGRAGEPGPAGTSVSSTIALVPGSCAQINDASSLQADLYPPDPIGAADSHEPWGLSSFSLPACTSAVVRVTYHGAAFNGDWVWRNYGPRIPGNEATFAWYTFSGARRIDAQSWELVIDARREGNYRNDAGNILFVGGPALLPGRIFDNGFD